MRDPRGGALPETRRSVRYARFGGDCSIDWANADAWVNADDRPNAKDHHADRRATEAEGESGGEDE